MLKVQMVEVGNCHHENKIDLTDYTCQGFKEYIISRDQEDWKSNYTFIRAIIFKIAFICNYVSNKAKHSNW